MSKSQYHRKSGAITIKDNGKIVGNIGRGKNNVPTPHDISRNQEDSIIAPSTEKSSFTTSQQKMFSLITENTEYNYTITVTLWNLTSSQPFADRIKILAQHFGKLSQEDREKFFVEHLNSEKFYNNLSKAMTKKQLDEESYGVLIQHPNYSIRATLLLNANMPLPLLRKAADDPSSQCRCVVAGKIPSNEYTILDKLVTDPEPLVRESLTHNADLSQTLLRKLADDTDSKVHAGVARHWNTPIDVLDKLYNKYSKQAEHEDISREPLNLSELNLLLDIAQHPNVSNQILKDLVQMDNPTIKNVAQKWLNMRGGY